MANTEFAPPAGGPPPAPPAKAPLLSAGLLLGIGMGGFVDGIVFHQLLQTHSMLSGVRPGLTLAEANPPSSLPSLPPCSSSGSA